MTCVKRANSQSEVLKQPILINFLLSHTIKLYITLIGVNGRVGNRTCSGKICFYFLVYKMSKAKSQIFMAYRRFYFIFILFLFYDDISDRRSMLSALTKFK